jgi:hypothetical protein
MRVNKTSSIVDRPSSIIQRPASIVQRRSAVVIVVCVVLFAPATVRIKLH